MQETLRYASSRKQATFVILAAFVFQTASALSLSPKPTRKMFLQLTAKSTVALSTLIFGFRAEKSFAFSVRNSGDTISPKIQEGNNVAYRSLSLNIENDANVPVAMWYPTNSDKHQGTAHYDHRISVQRIGELLAGWDFIPDFFSRDFKLEPTLRSVWVGDDIPLPSTGPVVILSHGYLGSRFDLSHLAEALAQEGFICLSPEFPESLSASYQRMDGLDRSTITARLLEAMKSDWNIGPSSYGIVGHSLGCSTVMSTGDETWTRVLIAGGIPRSRDGSTSNASGPVLFLSSMNDGAVSLSRMGGRDAIPADYVQLEDVTMPKSELLPRRAAFVFDKDDAPNHISFLSEDVNDAMIDLLSPLLPVAQTLSIPVLDFDKYKISRDSKQTAEVVIPLVTTYLKQNM